jgi:hypothetical protein
MFTVIVLLDPANWEMWTAFGTVALAIIGGISLAYAIVQLREFRKESKIKHLMELVTQFEGEPIASYRRILGSKRTPDGFLVPLDLNNPPPELHDVMNFFEHLGYLLDGGYLDLEGVSVEFHYWILNLWADARRLIPSEQSDNPLYYEYFEKMVKRLLNYDRPGTGVLQLPTDADVEEFYKEEAHRKTGSPIPKQKSKRRPRSQYPEDYLPREK